MLKESTHLWKAEQWEKEELSIEGQGWPHIEPWGGPVKEKVPSVLVKMG